MSTTIEAPTPLSETATGMRSQASSITVALAGNPNAGKTTLFNALTGLRQKVANYPGVTVERKEGVWLIANDMPPARLIDLPGLYSLDAASMDEQIAHDVVTGKLAGQAAPDVIVCVVDATNLVRNLYLVAQLIEYGRPLVVALTMFDLAQRRGLEVDVQQLSSALGVSVVPVTAAKGIGIESLARVVAKAVVTTPPVTGWKLEDAAELELSELMGSDDSKIERHQAMRDLYGEGFSRDEARRERIEKARSRLAANDPDWWHQPLLARYDWIDEIGARVVRDNDEHRSSTTERIDRIITHRYLGPLVLVIVLYLVFQTIFSWASLPMDLIDKGFSVLGDAVRNQLPAGLLTDLLVDGVIAGVGGVLVFLPQILLLFFFIAVLEDSGYMARAAFLMDRLMRGVGLHGKAFMPLLSSFGCAIPGIMATRTIENPKDRLATIMIAPFMSCSARLPVYTLMIAAFFSSRKLFGFLSIGALMIMAMYLLGIIVAVCVAFVLKRTILKAPTPPLVMEMPPYRLPNLLTILQTMLSRAGLFVKRAGTVILAISILLWALVAFPRSSQSSVKEDVNTGVSNSVEEARTEVAPPPSSTTAGIGQDSDLKGEQLRKSFAGRAGHFLEPIIAPLGFDWKMGVALIASFAAREVLVSTLSIIYNAGSGDDARSESLIRAVREAKRPDGSPAWTPLVALSMMVFFVLACQCMSTVAIVRRETNSWRWPIFMVAYMTLLAYIASLITFQGGRLLGLS